jgi:NhaP-type Na+/H+ or K+/H+ antiporter
MDQVTSLQSTPSLMSSKVSTEVFVSFLIFLACAGFYGGVHNWINNDETFDENTYLFMYSLANFFIFAIFSSERASSFPSL